MAEGSDCGPATTTCTVSESAVAASNPAIGMIPYDTILSYGVCSLFATTVGYYFGRSNTQKPEPLSEREGKLLNHVESWRSLHSKVLQERDKLAAIATKHSITYLLSEEPDDKPQWIKTNGRNAYDAPFFQALKLAEAELLMLASANPPTGPGSGFKISFEIKLNSAGWLALQRTGRWSKLPKLAPGKWSIFSYGTQEYIVPTVGLAFENYIKALTAQTVISASNSPDTGEVPVRLIVELWKWDRPSQPAPVEVRYIEVPVAITCISEVQHPEYDPFSDPVYAAREQERIQNEQAARLAAELELDPELARKVTQLRSRHAQ